MRKSGEKSPEQLEKLKKTLKKFLFTKGDGFSPEARARISLRKRKRGIVKFNFNTPWLRTSEAGARS